MQANGALSGSLAGNCFLCYARALMFAGLSSAARTLTANCVVCSLGYPTARRTESGGEALQLAAAGDAEEAQAGSARAEPGPSKLLQLPVLVQEVSRAYWSVVLHAAS